MAAVVQNRESEFVSALDASLEGFVHRTLKEQQRECIRQIVCEKKDIFDVLPTGFGKSAIYQFKPLSPNIYILILQTGLHTFP